MVSTSGDSSHSSVNSFKGQEDEIEQQEGGAELELVRTVDESVKANPSDNVLTRLATFSKQLSHVTTRNSMVDIKIDPNDFELQKVLEAITHRATSQGVHTTSVGVEMDDVTVYGEDEAASFAPTIAEMLTAPFRVKEHMKKISGKIANANSGLRKINKDVNLVCNPGEMVLVLGRPGAGCSTMLKTIAGELDQYVKTEGDMTYDNIPQEEMIKHFKKEVIYNPELDVHFPHLTVDQTLKFAIACRTPSYNFPGFDKNKYIETFRDILCTVYGLTHTKNTKVGNDYIRGVSGGERKRVSIAEVMTAKPAVLCFDNATRGLDASTALEFTEALRTSTNIMKMSSFVTIYQASQNIYELFDKVVVLYLGRQVYYGRTEDAKAYFENMGYLCPARQSTAEFLTAVTDPLGRYAKPGMEGKIPHTAEEFEEYWRASPEFAALKEELSQKKKDSKAQQTIETMKKAHEQERQKFARPQSRYTINYATQLKLCTIRGFQRILGDKTYSLVTIFAGVFQAFIIGSLFWDIPTSTSGGFSRAGVVFFALLYFALMSMAEISVSFGKRPILFKQKGYSFYHPSAEVLGYILNDIPIKLLASILFSVVLYFLAGLKSDAGAFFTFVLFLNLGAQTMSTLFQAIASLSPSIPAANSVSGVFLMASLLYTSYMIQKPSMHPWFKWISYINPMLYCFEGLLTTEFHGRKLTCDSLAPSGPSYVNAKSGTQACAFTGSVSGQAWVSGDRYMKLAYDYSFNHVWRNFGIIVGFILFFIAINCIAVETIKESKGAGDHLSFLRGKGRVDDIIVKDGEKVADIESQEYVQESAAEQNDQLATAGANTKPVAGIGSDEVFMWQHVDYTIPYKGATRQLLDDIQGYCKPGTLTALMGESGAGKTTLLNVLSRRIDMGVITGDMLVDGKPIDQSFERRTGYVQQQDMHIAHMTVRESLQFAARMRRPLSVPEDEKMEYVEKIIEILHMGPYADAIVGEPGKGLNVEQRKKLSVGVELVAKPSLLLFLDEPTSGLDSQSAWAIIQVIRGLANAGQAILCTIHQPSATLIEEFDRLLLLRKGGQTVYFGDIGKNSRTMLDYFEGHGARKCGKEENPAEYILEVIGAGATASTDQNWNDVWVNSEHCAQVTKEIEEMIAERSHKPAVAAEEHMTDTFATPYLYQFRNVFWRTSLEFWRDTDYCMSRLTFVTIGGLFIGFTYWDLKSSIVGLQNTLLASFLCLIMCAPLSAQIQEKAISARELYVVRESKSNTFHWSILLLVQFLVEIPYCIVFSTLYFCCFYFPLKSVSTDASTAGFFWFTYSFFFQMYYISFALWMVYFAPDLPTANLLFSLFFSFVVSFCSVAQPQALAPGFWKFMFDLSPFTYFVQNLTGTVLHDRKVVCKTEELAIFDPPAGQTCGEWAAAFLETATGYLTNSDATENCGYCQYSVGDDYMKNLNMKYSYRWRNIGFFCVYIIFNLAAMLAFYWVFMVNKTSPLGHLMKLIENIKSKREKSKKEKSQQ